MSITFFFNGDTMSSTSYNCMFCEPGAPTPGCVECNGTGKVAFTNDDHAVHLSNFNAYAVAAAIDWKDFNYAGEMPALEFIKLLASPILGGCDPSEDYYRLRVQQLLYLGIAAAQQNQLVRWG